MSSARPPASLAGLRWLAQAALVLVATGVAALAGVLLSVVGAAPVAFVLVVGLTVLVWSPRVGGSLSIALAAAGLATGATAGQLSEDRVAPSIGQLTLAPARASELDSKSYRRGAGSIFVDLRRSTFQAGQRIRLKLRSDGGRIVVALPMRQCVAVDLKARSGLNEGFGGEALVMLERGRAKVAAERWAWSNPPMYRDPFLTERENNLAGQVAPDGSSATWWTAGHGVDLFGQLTGWTMLLDGSGEIAQPRALRGSQVQELAKIPVSVARPTTDRRAPLLELDAEAAAAVVVRDYPLDVGPMSTNTGVEGEGDMSWPRTIRMPVSPEEMQTSLAWRENWTTSAPARRAHRPWKAWERDVIGALHRKAQLAAGPCATRDLRQAQWEAARYGILDRSPESSFNGRAVRLLAVNADGEVLVRGEEGTRVANRDAAAIVRGSGLRILTPAELAQRRIQFDAVSTPEVVR